MAGSHIQRRLEQTETYKRTLAHCRTQLSNFLLCTHYAANTWDRFKTRLMAMQVPVDAHFITCKICEETELGHFFEKSKKIVLCANHLRDEDFTSTVVHELVHAYDDARVKMDYTSPDHVACSEVRAANLSGECKTTDKGWFSTAPDYGACIRNHAKASVMGNPHFTVGKEEAEQAVQRVWDICFNDYDPLAPPKYKTLK